MRLDFNAFNADNPQFLTCWGCQSGWVYLKLQAQAPTSSDARRRMPAWEKRNIPDEPNGDIRYNPGDDQDWHFVNLQDVHLGKAQDGTMTPGNDRRTITTFAIIAVLILGMAVVNFTNLATARASQRAREVALRKVLGRDAQAADRPVRRRIDPDLRGRDAARARARRAAGEAVRRLPRCRPGA